MAVLPLETSDAKRYHTSLATARRRQPGPCSVWREALQCAAARLPDGGSRLRIPASTRDESNTSSVDSFIVPIKSIVLATLRSSEWAQIHSLAASMSWQATHASGTVL